MEQEKFGEIFYNAYKNFNGDLTKIEYYANNYQLSVKKFLGITMSYIKNNVVKPQYAILLDKLLKLKTKNIDIPPEKSRLHTPALFLK